MSGGRQQAAKLLLCGRLHRRGGACLCLQWEDIQEPLHHGPGNNGSRGQTLAKERAFIVVNVLQGFYGFNCLFELSITLTTEDRLSQMVG